MATPAGEMSLGQGPPEATDSQSSTNPADERAVRDIMELRREQGDLFSGTLFEELARRGATTNS